MSTATAPKPIRRIARPATRTTLAKVGQTDPRWWIVDATGLTLGRLASAVAMRLMGKHKPTYTPNVDTGDFVIVLNAGKIKVSGRKAEQRTYEKYTYYPGGRKVVTHKDFVVNHPTALFSHAVRRMLPKSKLGEQMLSKLKVYREDKHPHAAQRPEAWKPAL